MSIDETLNGKLVLGAPEWLTATIVISALMIAFVVWSYMARKVPAWVRVTGIALKLAAVFLLAVCLLQPMRSGTRPVPMSNVLAVLVDTSASMNVSPSSSAPSRAATVDRLLHVDNTWRDELARVFEMRTYAFDSRLENVASMSPFTSEGESSLIATSLTGVGQRLAGRPIAGVMLFSDGNATDVDAAKVDWKSLGYPVYPVVPASESALADLSLDELTVTQSDFESAPVTVSASLRAKGMQSREATVRLTDTATGKVVEEQRVKIGDDATPNRLRFRFRPEKSGVGFYALTAIDQDDSHGDAADNATSGIEATRINNSRLVKVERKTGPYRILYVAGRPNWEFKFIRRALTADQEIQLVGLLRIANKEPKFSFRDRGVSSTNPLFAGLGNDEEEAAEQYDEPVILRLGVNEAEELSRGFPTSPEELFDYHAVILDDLETDFFTQDQMLMLRRFVAQRGGGLMFLGGQESFRGEAFSNSPLGDLSPVYSAARDALAKGAGGRFDLTREGMLQPWMRLRETEQAESNRLDELAPLTTLNPIGDVKPGASVFARVSEPGASLDGPSSERGMPAVAVQRFGNGRTTAVPIGDLWRWSMRRDKDDQQDPEQLWRQWMRWLVGEVPRRTEVSVEAPRDATQPAVISVLVRDELYRQMDNADVNLEIKPSNGELVTLKATPDAKRAGFYTAEFWTKQTDGFVVTAKVTGPDGAPLASDMAGWVSEPKAAEFERLETNREWLEMIATESGGRVLRDDELDAFADQLPQERVPVTQPWTYPLWHSPWVMLGALVCLCAEWGLRRWKGLA